MTTSTFESRYPRLQELAASIAAWAVWLATLFGPGLAHANGPVPLDKIATLTLEGDPTKLASTVRGPTVLNVWATWCPPCRTEMPSLERMQAVLAPEGIRVFALSVDTDQNLVREFVLKYRLTLPVGIAAEPDQAMKALDVLGLPLTIYLDATGREVGRHVGQRDWDSNDALAEVRRALGTRAAGATR